MPYIAPQPRQQLDPLIDQLAHCLVDQAKGYDYDGAFAGLLNYACTRLALQVARQRFGPLRYWLIAIISGTFKNMADEFYRRVAIPYEDQQLAKSGDLDVYAAYLREMAKM